jgi:hypothetical protein
LGLPAQLLRQFHFNGDAIDVFFGKKRTASNQEPHLGILDHFLKCLETAQPVDFIGDISLQPEAVDRVFRVNLIPMTENGNITHIIGFARGIGG